MNNQKIKNNHQVFKSIMLAVTCFFVTSVSQATLLSVSNITNNTGTDLSSQLLVDYSSVAGGVEFSFTNNIGIASSITDVYFDLGSNTGLFSGISITGQTAGVSFDLFPSPSDLPGGNTVGFTSDFGADSTSPASQNGVDALGEELTILAMLGSGFTYDNFLADLMNGVFRVGLHVQAIAGINCENSMDKQCGSDSYTNVSAVPVPAAAWLFGTALIGFFGASRRNKVQQMA